MTEITEHGGWAGLSYGATERLLAELHETTPESIRSRFRKLRLKPFPDEIRSGTGRRIAYDLPRILALAAVFDLNRLYVPQGRAVELVETCWPEWCRAFLAAAAVCSLLPDGLDVPLGASSSIRLLVDAYNDGFGGPELMKSEAEAIQVHGTAMPPSIEVDTMRIVGKLASTVSPKRALSEAFTRLERAFGWTAPATPHRASVAEMSRGRGFLDEGPYFERAKALLCEPSRFPDPERTPLAFGRMQALIDYIEDPAPIDRWKAEIGDDEDRPRLGHLLSFWAASKGLKVRRRYPEIAQALAGREVHDVALGYIASTVL
jgi:hypothetical protein